MGWKDKIPFLGSEEEHELDDPYWDDEGEGVSNQEVKEQNVYMGDGGGSGGNGGGNNNFNGGGIKNNGSEDDDDGGLFDLFLKFRMFKYFIGMGPYGWAALIIILLLLIVIAYFVITALLGFLGVAAGAGAGALSTALGPFVEWGGYLGDQAQVAVQPYAPSIDPVANQVMEKVNYVACLTKGPGCYREWQAEKTRRPGSDRVGETYLLSVERFDVGQGEQFDVAFQRPDRKIPASFAVSNTRRGLRGIIARDVEYRLRMSDGERTNCGTEWQPVDYSSELDELSNNDLFPGVTFSDFVQKEGFTIAECGILQPSYGESRNVFVDVEYGYSSQATLQIEAIAREILSQDPDINIDKKNSETADTPVAAALTVSEPVLFDQEGTGPEASTPFSVTATLNTDENNLEYRIKDIEITSSSQVEILDEGGNCDFQKTGEDKLQLKNEVRDENLEDGQGDLRWFSKQNSPPIFGCTMRLSSPEDLSPTGETLTMSIDSNYTVRQEGGIDNFEVFNSECGRKDLDCPMLVTEGFDSQSSYDWQTTCTGVDASTGCSVVDGKTWEGEQVYNRTDLHHVNQEVEGTEFEENISNTAPLQEGEDAISLDSFLVTYFEVEESKTSLEEGDYGESEKDEILNTEWAKGLEDATGRTLGNVTIGVTPEEREEPFDNLAGELDAAIALLPEESGRITTYGSEICGWEDMHVTAIALVPHPECSGSGGHENSVSDDVESLSEVEGVSAGEKTTAFLYDVCVEYESRTMGVPVCVQEDRRAGTHEESLETRLCNDEDAIANHIAEGEDELDPDDILEIIDVEPAEDCG